MKRLGVIVLTSVFFMLASFGSVLAGGAHGDRCSPTGTWYGGSYRLEHAGYKYQYSFVPSGQGLYFAMADGVYNPDTLMAAVATTWTGVLQWKRDGDDDEYDDAYKKSEGGYEIRLIALTSNDPIDPPEELPMIWAVRGDLLIKDCHTITIEYDWFAIYEWDQVPFVDEPVTWLILSGDDPIIETIKRMPMYSELPVPPEP